MGKVKSAQEHLDGGRQPHIIHVVPPGAPGYREANGRAMVVSSPAEVDAMVRALRPGEVVDLNGLRGAIARRHKVAVACPVSTAIFWGMSARAAEEKRSTGVPDDDLTPWWRVLKTGGTLNPKSPGGVERQAALLRAEGVRVSPLRQHLAVYDYQERVPGDPLEERT